MKIRKVKYKVIQTTIDTFKVCKIVSYFGFDWSSEILENEYYTISDARSFIKFCTDNSVEIKYY